MQKLLEETQLDMNEFDNLLQPIIDTCTKDAISVRAGGPGWARCAQNLVLLTGGNLLKPIWAEAALEAPSLPLLFRLEHLQKREERQAEAAVCSRALEYHSLGCALTSPPPLAPVQAWAGEPSLAHLSPWLLQAGKNWMFSNAKSPPHCELMAGHLRNRITADGAHFELRLHLIYLINDVLHHW